jgi:hypothetical protein
VDLHSFYTLLMVAAAIFVFGLTFQRRREYVTLRAHGMQIRELGALVLERRGSSRAWVGGGIGGRSRHGRPARSVLRPLFTSTRA